jgi:hypothetical protein
MLEKVLDFVEAYCMGVLNAFDAVVDWASDYVSPWVILIGFVLILSAIQLVMPLGFSKHCSHSSSRQLSPVWVFCLLPLGNYRASLRPQ